MLKIIGIVVIVVLVVAAIATWLIKALFGSVFCPDDNEEYDEKRNPIKETTP